MPKRLLRTKTPSSLTAADLMASPVHTVLETTSALVAAEEMARHRVRHLVVVDREDRVTGVLSDRDLRAAQPSRLLVSDGAMRNKALAVMHVGDLMAAHPHVVRTDDPISRALRLMRDHRVGCLPVVDRAGTLKGILTGGDVLELTLALVER